MGDELRIVGSDPAVLIKSARAECASGIDRGTVIVKTAPSLPRHSTVETVSLTKLRLTVFQTQSLGKEVSERLVGEAYQHL
jgi:hypothetical protein